MPASLLMDEASLKLARNLQRGPRSKSETMNRLYQSKSDLLFYKIAAQTRKKTLLRWTFLAWRNHTTDTVRIRQSQLWMSCWLAKRCLKKWYSYCIYIKKQKQVLDYATCRGEICRMIFYLRRWKIVVFQIRKRIHKATYTKGKRYKLLCVFLGYLLRYLYKIKMNSCWQHWTDLIRSNYLWTMACAFYERMLMKRCLRAIWQWKNEAFQKQNNERAANTFQKWLLSAVATTQEYSTKSILQTVPQENTHMPMIEQQATLPSFSTKLSQSPIASITSSFQEANILRRKKEQEDIISAELENLLNESRRKFLLLEGKEVKEANQKFVALLKTKKGKECVQREFGMLKRSFFQRPVDIHEYREQMLQSQANIFLSVLDGIVLNTLKLSMDDFLQNLSRTIIKDFNNGDPSLVNREAFHRFLTESNILDVNVDKFYEELALEAISLTELKQRLELTYQYNGVEGCRWKMFVDPNTKVMLFYDVMSKETVYENKMISKKLLSIAKENLRVKEEVCVRRSIFRRREEERMQIIQTRSVIFSENVKSATTT